MHSYGVCLKKTVNFVIEIVKIGYSSCTSHSNELESFNFYLGENVKSHKNTLCRLTEEKWVLWLNKCD